MSVRRLVSLLVAVLVATFAALGLFGASVATAVPTLTDQTSPSPGEVLSASPKVLTLVFSEALTTDPAILVLDATGAGVSSNIVGTAQRGDDAQTWFVDIKSALAPGTYTVKWQVQTGGNGEYKFSIGQPIAVDPATTPAPVAAADGISVPTTAASVVDTAARAAAPTSGTSAAPAGSSRLTSFLEVLGRLISTMGIALIFGGLAIIALAWPEGVEYVITSRYLRAVWIAALVGTVLMLIATHAALADNTLGSSISPVSWLELRDQGGAALLLRLVFVAASGWVVLAPERVVDSSTQIPAFAAPMLTMLTFGFSRTGSGGGGALGVGASIIHALAFAVWIGGAALLARVVVVGPGDEDLLHAIRGFGRLAGPALIGVVLSGVVRSTQLSGGGSQLLSTGYGRLLLLKAAGVAMLAYVATVNRQTVRDRLGRAHQLNARAAGRLRRAFSVELLVGVVVMALSAWMVNTSPPGVSASPQASRVKAVVQADLKDAGIDVSVGAAPAIPGTNTIVITVRKPVTGLVDMTVKLVPAGNEVSGILIPVAKTLTGKGIMRVEGVPLAAPGTWIITITGSDTNGQLTTLNGSFVIGETAAAAGATTTTSTSTVTAGSGTAETIAGTPNTATTVTPPATGG